MKHDRLKREFGSAIRRRRKQPGLSQEQLGARAGLHRTYLSDVERGARNVSLESIKTMAVALEVSLGDLFAEL